MGKFDGILLLSDVDGTIARDGIISDENIEAVEYFKENGGLFTFATGRMPEYIRKLSLTPNVPVISCNGTKIYDFEKEKTLGEYFVPQGADKVIRDITENYAVERWYTFTANGSYEFLEKDEIVFDGYENEMYKVVFVFKDEAEAVEAKRAMGDKYHKLAFERSWSTGLEMRSGAAGKGLCLKLLKDLTGAHLAIAAGDFENDLDMLRCADISYAPADALGEVKNSVDRVGVSFDENLIEYIIKDIEKEL